MTVISVWIEVFKPIAKYPGWASAVPLILLDARSVLVKKQLSTISPGHPVCGNIGKLPSEGDCANGQSTLFLGRDSIPPQSPSRACD